MENGNRSTSSRNHETTETYIHRLPQKRPESEANGAAVLQSPYKNQTSDSTRKGRGNGDGSVPNTPDSHSLKRKNSDLTTPPSSKIQRTPDTSAVRSEMYRVSLGIPPPFNLNISPGQLSPSSTGARRNRPRLRENMPGIDLQPAILAGPSITDSNLNLSISNDGRASSSNASPVFIRGNNKRDENDDVYGPLTTSDHDTTMLTRKTLLPEGDRNERSSYSSFHSERTSAQRSERIMYRQVEPSVRKLIPYANRPPIQLAPEMTICEAIIKPLTKREMGIAKIPTSSGEWKPQTSHAGWIYVYQLPDELHTVKIGITQASVERRLESWTEQCGHAVQIAYPTTEPEREAVPNIYRLEALVHAELAASRLEVVDCACRIRHNEWFDEASTHARQVVLKWSNWMRTKPYEELRSDSWHLSLQYLPLLLELSRPVRREWEQGSPTNPIQI